MAAAAPVPLNVGTPGQTNRELPETLSRKQSVTGPVTSSNPPSTSSKAQTAARRAELASRELIDLELNRATQLASARWTDCLACLSSSLPIISSNPYLLVLQPPFLYDYLDSLTETLANLHNHTSDLDTVRGILQQVYNSFIDLGRFAKYQPAFFFDDANSLKRFIRLLEQVTHKNSDKALYPNILSLLTPTLARPDIYPMLLQLKLLPCLFRFAQDRWIPANAALMIIAAILNEMSQSDLMREAMLKEPGFDRLCRMASGTEPGLTREQQYLIQQAVKWHVDVSADGENDGEGDTNGENTNDDEVGEASTEKNDD